MGDQVGSESKVAQDANATDEAKMLKSLFVTQEEDAYEEFEREKDAQVEGQIGKSVAKTTLK